MKVKNKIVSYRTCLYCNKQYNKEQLVRFVKFNGSLIIDKEKTMPGRGYWLYVSSQALKDPKLIQILSKRTKCSINANIVKELTQYENK